jgi:hypothetical protein
MSIQQEDQYLFIVQRWENLAIQYVQLSRGSFPFYSSEKVGSSYMSICPASKGITSYL